MPGPPPAYRLSLRPPEFPLPTVDSLQDALYAALGSRDPEAWALKKLGESPLAKMARDCRSAGAGVPPQFGRLRRGRLVAWDRCSTTWEAWDVEGGMRVLLRAARADGWGNPLPGHGLPNVSPWPHQVSAPFSCTLADLLPLEDTPDILWSAGIVAAILRDLETVHQHGRRHGQLSPSLIAWDGRWHLLDTGCAEPTTEAEDLAGLGRLMVLVDEGGPIGDLGHSFLEDTPPSSADARFLFQRALADHLAETHHRLLRRMRGVSRVNLLSRVLELCRRLRVRVPPPVGVGCLAAGQNGSFTLLVSDGHTVRGGATASLDLRNLPVIAGPDTLDAPANRMLIRAWATRRPSTEPLRQQLQNALGSSDTELEQMMRWLAAAARLRAETLLLAARYR